MSNGLILLTEINDMMDVADPSTLEDNFEEVEDGEIVVGKLDDGLKKLYVALNAWEAKMQEEAKTLHDQLGENPDEVTADEMRSVMDFVDRRDMYGRLLTQLLWTSVRRAYNLFDCDVGIRKGFQIVRSESRQPAISIVLMPPIQFPTAPGRH